MIETFHVYAKLLHKDHSIELRRLLLQDIETITEANKLACQAVEDNRGTVLASWVEPAQRPKTKKEVTK